MCRSCPAGGMARTQGAVGWLATGGYGDVRITSVTNCHADRDRAQPCGVAIRRLLRERAPAQTPPVPVPHRCCWRDVPGRGGRPPTDADPGPPRRRTSATARRGVGRRRGTPGASKYEVSRTRDPKSRSAPPYLCLIRPRARRRYVPSPALGCIVPLT